MEVTEIADKIHERHLHGHAPPGSTEAHLADDAFRKRAGLSMGIIAMLLAITTLGGAYAMKEMLTATIRGSDSYAFYQAKNIRQTSYRLAADQLEVQIATPGVTDEVRKKGEDTIKRWRATADRYESEPATNDGKKELMAQAQAWDKKRDHAREQDPNFDFAEALFQIAIVLGSVSIVSASRQLLGISIAVASLATLLCVNGFFLFVHLPFD